MKAAHAAWFYMEVLVFLRTQSGDDHAWDIAANLRSCRVALVFSQEVLLWDAQWP